jgi:shikimate dehydrogenase
MNRAIDAETRLCAVIGNPIHHSLSPAIHNAGYNALGLNYVYTAFQVEDLKATLDGMRGLDIRGLSVTIPHKTAIIAYLDAMDEAAQKLGSVNTVYWKDEKLWGTSTDGYGAMRALRAAGIETEGAKVVFTGAGGVARAISFTLALEGACRELVFLESYCPELGVELAKAISEGTNAKTRAASLDESTLELELADADLLIQCTPLGMTPNIDQTPIPKDLLHSNLAVFDTVYTPKMTRLMREAGEAGCTLALGREMFLHQAAIQFELFTGSDAPLDAMRHALDKALS